MTELDLRTLVREAVQRHLGRSDESGTSLAAPRPGHGPGPHASQAMYLTVVNSTDQCVIEPSVRCNHCGYCKAHGF